MKNAPISKHKARKTIHELNRILPTNLKVAFKKDVQSYKYFILDQQIINHDIKFCKIAQIDSNNNYQSFDSNYNLDLDDYLTIIKAFYDLNQRQLDKYIEYKRSKIQNYLNNIKNDAPEILSDCYLIQDHNYDNLVFKVCQQDDTKPLIYIYMDNQDEYITNLKLENGNEDSANLISHQDTKFYNKLFNQKF